MNPLNVCLASFYLSPLFFSFTYIILPLMLMVEEVPPAYVSLCCLYKVLALKNRDRK